MTESPTEPVNPATSAAYERRFRSEIETRERRIAEVETEIARLRASGAENAGAGGAATPPAAPPPASLSETAEQIAARMVREREESRAFGQALVDLTTDPESAALLLQARNAEVTFVDGAPRITLNGEVLPITRDSLAAAGLSKALIKNVGATGSGGRSADAANVADDAFTIKQKALSNFEFYKTNRAKILKMRGEGII